MNRGIAVRQIVALLGDRLAMAGLSVPQMPKGRSEFLLWVRQARRVLRESEA
jgi:hypothetical protein